MLYHNTEKHFTYSVGSDFGQFSFLAIFFTNWSSCVEQVDRTMKFRQYKRGHPFFLGAGVEVRTQCIHSKRNFWYIWMFPKIVVPPNHPF